MERHILTESDKIKILEEYVKMGEVNHWSELAARTRFPESTVRYCVNSYHKTNQLFPKRGSQTKITSNEKSQIVHSVEGNCETTLSQIGSQFSHSKSTIYNILDESNIHFYSKTPKCELDDQHIQNRILFCSKFINMRYCDLPTIIFTDESTVEMDPE